MGQRFIGCDLSEPYTLLARQRIGSALRETRLVRERREEPTLFPEEDC
jgi:DNA modification methylase